MFAWGVLFLQNKSYENYRTFTLKTFCSRMLFFPNSGQTASDQEAVTLLEKEITFKR